MRQEQVLQSKNSKSLCHCGGQTKSAICSRNEIFFEQYDEICKYFTERKQRDNDANEIRKHLQLYNLSLGEYLVNRYALWLDFRTIDENELHRTGRRIENASEGITLQIEKKAESPAGALNAYIYLIMDAQLNIQNGTYISVVY